MFQVRGKKSKLSFTANEFVAKGGEGSIYKRGNLVYKIYEDPSQMIPEAKIRELNEIKEPNVIKPIDIIIDANKRVVGFTMNWVSGFALCKLFTNDFRNRNNISDDQTLELIESIKNATTKIHDAKCLIVDGNEFNYLVDGKTLITPYFIDVNSWQTPSFPATAIMPSVRDWKSNKFSEVTDWFSFAVVSFQLFVGIHPFKGRYKGYKRNDFSSRVRDCVSVLNPKVKVPPSTRDFSLIPNHYKDWYYDLFEKGERKLPPAAPGVRGPVTTRIIVVHSTNNFEVKEIKEFETEIMFHEVVHGNEITKTKKYLHSGTEKYRVSPETEILFTPRNLTPILVRIKDNFLEFLSLDDNTPVNLLSLICEDKMIIGNTLFAKNKGNLMEIAFNEINDKIFPTVKTTWGIMPNSSEMFSGVIYQSTLGVSTLVIPRPSYQGNSLCSVLMVPELNDYRVVDAKHESQVCIVTCHKDNSYSRFIFKFDDQYKKYTCRVVSDIDYTPINFVVLDNGVVVSIIDNEVIEIFSNKYGKDDVKEIHDPDVDVSMKLTKDGTQARFFKGNKLYTIKMK
jgi:hypothetical protein